MLKTEQKCAKMEAKMREKAWEEVWNMVDHF
jgi:hypothetical protein